MLPFASLGGGEEQDQFVDGVTESLTTDLSRLANTVVVARNTAFTYKGKPADAKQIGRELNVRYILEGSIQRGAGRMRINAQFIDAATGNHIWADRFDKPIADLFDMQDEIVSRLANQLRAELIAAEAERAEKEPNPDALDYYFRGVAAFNKGRLENVLRAKDLFEEALKLNPAHVDAIVGAARADVIVALYVQEERAARLKSAEGELLKALSIDPRSHWAHLWLGYVLVLTKRAARGIGEFERALSLNRNIGVAHAWTGLAKIMLGRAEETDAHVDEAFRISPIDGVTFLWKYIAGLAKLFLGADAEAADLFRELIDASRSFPLNHFHNAAALAHLGKQSEAEAEVRAGLAIAPGFHAGRLPRLGRKRQSGVSRPARAGDRGDAQGRRAGRLNGRRGL